MRHVAIAVARTTAALAAVGVLAGCGGAALPGPAAAPSPPPAPTATAPTATAPTTTVPAPAGATSAPAVAGEHGESPAGGGLPRCTTGELSVGLGPGEGAAGSVYRDLIFTNTGSRTCELRGFPGVSYVTGDDGHQVGPAAVMQGERGGQVPIPPGRTAVTPLQLVNVQNFDSGVCRPTPVRGLRVYPPGDTAALFVPMDGTGCAGTPPGPQLSVQTMRAP
jgi:Protein of unknown function (DUF4232)